jgi:protein-S-isoprenylcysteine O-methyltransferase Ste14
MSARLQRFVLACGNVFFRHRNAIFPITLLVLVLISPPRPSFREWGVDQIADVIGVGLVIFGHTLRALVVGLAYIRRGGKGGKVHADHLVVEGIFAHSRNPLYLANMIILVGIFLVANSPLLTLVGVPFFAFAYGSIVFAEEDYLRRTFGETYVQYQRSVPRFLPRNLDIVRTMRGMSFDWRRVLRKEYGSIFVSATILLVIFFYEDWVRGGVIALRKSEPGLVAGAIAVVIFYGVVRILKKSKRLQATSASASK